MTKALRVLFVFKSKILFSNVSLFQYSLSTREPEQSCMVLFSLHFSADIHSHKKKTISLLTEFRSSCSLTAAYIQENKFLSSSTSHYLTLQWHDPHSPLLFLADTSQIKPNTALFCVRVLIFHGCNLYYQDQRDSNKACTCFTDTKSEKFPVLRYNLS